MSNTAPKSDADLLIIKINANFHHKMMQSAVQKPKYAKTEP